LDDLLNEDLTVAKVESETELESPQDTDETKEVTQSELEEAVTAFVEQLKADGRSIQQSLFTFINPEIADNTVVIKLIKQHKIQLEDIKVEFLQFLRSQLNHSGIHLKIKEIKKKAEGTRAYTGQEKFEVMAKKNPALLLLKDKLNLTIK